MSEKQSSGGNTKKKWILIAVLAAIAIGAYKYCFSSEAYIQKGDELWKQGKRVEAMRNYANGYDNFEDFKNRVSGSTKELIADYTQLIELEPKNAKYYCGRADCYEREKNYDAALDDYTKAIEIGGKEKDKYYKARGYVYVKMFDREHAVADAEKSASAKNNPRVLIYVLESYGDNMLLGYRNVLGDLSNQKYFDEAIFYYTESIKVFDELFRDNPATFDPHLYRGKAYALKQNYSQALADYTQGIKNGKVRIKQVENESAKLKYKVQELLDLKSKENDLNIPRHDMYEAYVRRGDIYKKQGDWANAIENYTEAIEVNEILTSSPEPTIVMARLWKIYACRGECC